MATPHRVLLVEDEPVLVRVFARVLTAANFAVDTACDGMVGLERLSQARYDVVLSDVTMPRLSGLDLLEHVKRTQPELPVVLMTALLDAEAYARARDVGSVRYLLKPVGIQQLVRAVESAVELGTFRRRARERRAALTR